jgi:hypothetical protein
MENVSLKLEVSGLFVVVSKKPAGDASFTASGHPLLYRAPT